MTMLNTIKNSQVFRDLKREHLEKVAAMCRSNTYRQGTAICQEGHEATEFYILTNGRVTLEMQVKPMPERPAIPTAVEVVEQGGSFGWSALVEPHIYNFSVRCLTDCTVLAIKGDLLLKVMASDPELGFAVMKRVSEIIALRLVQTRFRLISGLGLTMLGREMAQSG